MQVETTAGGSVAYIDLRSAILIMCMSKKLLIQGKRES